MRFKERRRWLLALALVAGIAAFTFGGPVYADDHGCYEGPCNASLFGVCEFEANGGGDDYCVCDGMEGVVRTCECSTGEYPPCPMQ